MTFQYARHFYGLLLILALAACVTINVYFPAAAAEQAADRIIQEVWGGTPGDAGTDQSQLTRPLAAPRWLIALSEWIIPSAHAQDINVSSPSIQALKQSLAARHRQLAQFYASGAIGLTADGNITIRDANTVGLAERNKLKKLVSADNRDRASLYREIAAVNGHPEWEQKIRATFGKQWIANAAAGWWYQQDGQWRQK